MIGLINLNLNFKKIKNFVRKGVNFGITQFLTQFTTVSRKYRALNRKQKLKFMKMWSLIWRDIP